MSRLQVLSGNKTEYIYELYRNPKLVQLVEIHFFKGKVSRKNRGSAANLLAFNGQIDVEGLQLATCSYHESVPRHLVIGTLEHHTCLQDFGQLQLV